MELNITLVIQMLNFFIAWLLLHVFYFSPAIQYMQEQQKAHDQLLEAIAVWQGRIAQKEYDSNLIWRDLNLFVRHHKPEMICNKFEQIRYDKADIVRQSGKQDDALVQTLKDILVTGISDVEL